MKKAVVVFAMVIVLISAMNVSAFYEPIADATDTFVQFMQVETDGTMSYKKFIDIEQRWTDAEMRAVLKPTSVIKNSFMSVYQLPDKTVYAVYFDSNGKSAYVYQLPNAINPEEY